MTSAPPSDGRRVLTLPNSRRTLLYESPLNKTRFHDAYQLVNAAANRADNIGTDEFPTFEYFRHQLLDHASASAGLSEVPGSGVGTSDAGDISGTLKGFVVVNPCRQTRSSRPTVCTLTIVTSEDLSGDDDATWRDLIDIGTMLARRCGPDGGNQTENADYETYSACVVDVFTVCIRQLMVYRAAGFVITACIPNSGKLNGLRGHADNYILYQEFHSLSVSELIQRSNNKLNCY
jgi:hypothetical protein